MLTSIVRGVIIISLLTPITHHTTTISLATESQSVDSNFLKEINLTNDFKTTVKSLIDKQTNKQIEENKQKSTKEQKPEDSKGKVYTFKISYYTSLESCCGKSDAITASGKVASYGMVALPNNISFGSTVTLHNENHRTFTCEDRGGAIKQIDDNTLKMDIFIPRNVGESDNQYLKRVRDYGTDTVEGTLILNEEMER